MPKDQTEEPRDMTEAEREQWLAQSKEMLLSLFLVNPIDNTEMGIVSDIIEVSSDTFAFYATNDPTGDKAIEFVVRISEATKTGDEEESNNTDAVVTEALNSTISNITPTLTQPETSEDLGDAPILFDHSLLGGAGGIMSDPNSGKIIGMNGEFLT